MLLFQTFGCYWTGAVDSIKSLVQSSLTLGISKKLELESATEALLSFKPVKFDNVDKFVSKLFSVHDTFVRFGEPLSNLTLQKILTSNLPVEFSRLIDDLDDLASPLLPPELSLKVHSVYTNLKLKKIKQTLEQPQGLQSVFVATNAPTPTSKKYCNNCTSYHFENICPHPF